MRKHDRSKAQQIQENTTGVLDLPFLLLVSLLTLLGLLMMFSASYARAAWQEDDSAFFFSRQALFVGLGIGCLLVAGRINYFVFYRIAFLALLISIVFLILVPVAGREVNGAKRWFEFGPISLQPSEMVKPSMIFSFAVMMSIWHDKMDRFRYGVAPYISIMALIAGLLYLEPHLSATIIILMVGAVMMLLGGTPMRWFALGGLVAAAFLVFYVNRAEYANERISSWLNPWEDMSNTGYQAVMSLYAIGSGGFLGLGLGRSRQKYLYLPEAHNDYVFAIVCEELGFVGAVGILILFSLLILRGYWIAIHARDRFGTLVAAGLTTKLAVQVFLNVGVVTGLLPATGISLPFFSYGGTALILQLLEMGIILSISRWCVNKDRLGKAKAQ